MRITLIYEGQIKFIEIDNDTIIDVKPDGVWVTEKLPFHVPVKEPDESERMIQKIEKNSPPKKEKKKVWSRKAISDEVKAEVYDLRSIGMDRINIAEEVGISKNSVYRILKSTKKKTENPDWKKERARKASQTRWKKAREKQADKISEQSEQILLDGIGHV